MRREIDIAVGRLVELAKSRHAAFKTHRYSFPAYADRLIGERDAFLTSARIVKNSFRKKSVDRVKRQAYNGNTE